MLKLESFPISTVPSLKLPDDCGTCTIGNSSVALNDGYS